MKTDYTKYLGISAITLQVTSAVAAGLSFPLTPAQPAWPAPAGDCHSPVISADGRWVAFVSAADNLVTNDNNGATDVFVRDRVLGQTILVSVDLAAATSGNGPSYAPAISSDGRVVAFQSTAGNLVKNDAGQAADVFVRDLSTGLTRLVSSSVVSGSGNLDSGSPALTPDGRYVLFTSRAGNLVSSDSNNGMDLFLKDLTYGTNALVSRNYANTGSHFPATPGWGSRGVSDDGRFVAFDSAATNLIRSDMNGRADVFVRDMTTRTNIPVTINLTRTGMANGDSGNISMDATGRFCAFESLASNLALNDTNTASDVFWWDRASGSPALLSVNTNGISSGLGSSTWPVMSRDGTVVAFLSTANDLVAGDANSIGRDLFRRDLLNGQTTLIEPAKTSGYFTVPLLSANGRFMLYQNNSNNLVLVDTQTGSRSMLAANTPIDDATMTDNADFIGYACTTDASGFRKIFVYERLTGKTELVSVADATVARSTGLGGAKLTPGAVSTNGEFVVFESAAGDFDPASTNLNRAVWFCDLTSVSNLPVRLGSLNPELSGGPSRRPVISPSGRWVAFDAIPDSTPITNLATRFSLYAFDRLAQTNLLVGGVGAPAWPSLASFSADGAALVFQSTENGVAGYNTTVRQVYYRNLTEPTNRLVSLGVTGTAPGNAASYEPAISPSGHYVAYVSYATNLTVDTVSGINVFLWDSWTGSNALVSASQVGNSFSPPARVAFWAEGALLSFQRARTNYLFASESLGLAATLPDTANVSVTADGRFVACERTGSYSELDANSLPDIYLIDLSTGSNVLVSINAQGASATGARGNYCSMSPDGRYVLFTGRASNLVTGDLNLVGDVFLRDLRLNRTILLSQNGSGTRAGNKLSGNPLWSPDGSTVLFESHASDLVTGDLNTSRDLFLFRLKRGDTDHDGMADDWELAFFNTLDRNGDGDFDQDGQNDLAESLAGTDPSNSGSVFQVITCYVPGADTFRLIWSAVPGKTYRVQIKQSALDPQWTDLPGDVLATDATAMKDDAGPSAGSSQCFYRVILVP